MREIFPFADVRPYTIWQRLGHRWAKLLHRIGIHDNIWTYRVGIDEAGEFEERPLVIGGPNSPAMMLAKQLECSVCHRKDGPIFLVADR